MTQNKKLNLSAMVSASEAKPENTVEPVKTQETPKSTSGIKINLASIKSQAVVKTPEVKQEEKKVEVQSSASVETIGETQTQETPKEQIAQNLETKTQQDTTQKINTPLSYKEKESSGESQDKKTDMKKLQISALKKPLETSDKSPEVKNDTKEEKIAKISELKKPLEIPASHHREDALMEKIAKDNQTVQINPNEVFHNYESEYKKKQGHILDSIEKIKEIANIKKLSKTNKIFIGSIIGLTAIGIGFLFHIDPNTHSLDNYKASILTLAGKQMTQEEIKQHEGNIQEEIAWKLEENNLGGYDLGFEILVNEEGAAVYKFDGAEYASKELLDVAIYSKLEELKKDRIRDYFKNNPSQAEKTPAMPEEMMPDEILEEPMNVQQEAPDEEIYEENTQTSEEMQSDTQEEATNREMDILKQNYSQSSQENSDENITEETDNNQEIQEENMTETQEYGEEEMYEEEFIFE